MTIEIRSMLVQLILLLFSGSTIVGVSIIGEATQPSLVSVPRGQSVTINCTFSYNGTSNHWIHAVWYRISLRGSNHSYGSKKPTCIPDVTLAHLNHCVSSLKLENASSDQSDYNYICVVKILLASPPIFRSGSGTRIQSYEPPEIFTVGGALVAGREFKLICAVKGLYLENISFKWACHGANIFTYISMLNSRTTVNGTPVATSQFEIIPKVTDHGIACRCEINRVTFRQPVTNEIKLHVMWALTLQPDVTYETEVLIYNGWEVSAALAPKVQDPICDQQDLHDGPQDPIITHKISNSGSYHRGTSSPITVLIDSSLELRCSVNSKPVSSVIWLKGSENYTEMSEIAAGLNSSKVKMTNIKPEDGGTYWCIANNSYGCRNASVWIKVTKEGHTWFWIFIIRFVAVTVFILILITLNCLVNC